MLESNNNASLNPKVMFYHALETDSFSVMCSLLKKALQQFKKSIIIVETPHYAQTLSDKLWQYQDDFIIPHGLINEPNYDRQPILLIPETEKNIEIFVADYIFYIGIVDVYHFSQYEKCIVIFDEYDQKIKQNMRHQYKNLKKIEINIDYYQQIQGKWELVKL